MKVLVLSGRFGMGHEMAANAICEQFRKIDEQAEIEKKDLLEELYPHISKFIFGGFRMMVEQCYGIYNFIYKMSGRMKVEIQPRGKALYKRLKKIMDGEQPDVIVCTHPMCVKAIASYKEKTGLKTPLVTCITDISMHPEWTAPQTDIYLVPTQEIKRHLMKEGTRAEDILVTGIPVRQQFLDADYRQKRENLGYMGRLCYAQDVSAVTGACLMVKKKLYEEAGGLDEGFAVSLNDVDFCLKLRQLGYLNVFTPFAELYHYESVSRGLDTDGEKAARYNEESARFREKWKVQLEAGDPYYNPNFTLDKSDFSLRV